MKFKSLIFASALVSGSVQAASKTEVGSFQLDPSHSKVGFEIPHLVISTVEGRFTNFDGSIDIAEAFEKSVIKASVEIASIDTGVAKRDEHLKSADFFDSTKFPSMKFESTGIKGSPDSFKLAGNLTIKGITKPVILDAKYLGAVADGYGNQKAAFTAKTKINRKDFGLTWNNAVEAGPVVGDEVTIDLRIQAGKPIKK